MDINALEISRGQLDHLIEQKQAGRTVSRNTVVHLLDQVSDGANELRAYLGEIDALVGKTEETFQL